MFPLLLFGLLVLFTVVYTISSVVFRLFLSPVASIPGPALAAFSFWYEFYYDVILRGRYTWKIAQLHEEMAPLFESILSKCISTIQIFMTKSTLEQVS